MLEFLRRFPRTVGVSLIGVTGLLILQFGLPTQFLWVPVLWLVCSAVAVNLAYWSEKRRLKQKALKSFDDLLDQCLRLQEPEDMADKPVRRIEITFWLFQLERIQADLAASEALSPSEAETIFGQIAQLYSWLESQQTQIFREKLERLYGEDSDNPE
jgi:hypothetical protein